MKKDVNRPHKHLGQNIAKRRKLRGFRSAESLAHVVGVSASALKDIERGKSEGHIATREAIAKALDCTVNDLYIDNYKQPSKLDPETIKAIRAEIKETLKEPFTKYVGNLDFDPEDVVLRIQNLPPDLKRLALALIYNDPSLAKGVKVDISAFLSHKSPKDLK